jgi:hypothetical protein
VSNIEPSNYSKIDKENINNISKLVTPQKVVQVRKSVKVALDEAEKALF